MKYLAPYLISLIAFVVIDFTWLGVVMSGFYQAHLGHLLSTTPPSVVPAIVFYLLYVAGIFVFAILPAVKEGKAVRALMLGVLLGLITYGTYDLTNQVTLRDWPLTVTVVDMVWGSFVTGVTAVVGFFLVRKFSASR